jgi:hypothetical protein
MNLIMKTIMKKINIVLLFVVTGLFFSCESKLDVLPEDSIVNELAFADKSLALGVVEGMYSSAQQDDVLNGTFQLSGEWMADNVDFEGTFPTFNEIRLFAMLSTNGSIFAIWDDNYETIGSANLIVDNVPLVVDPTFTDAERAQAVAEARFMRALVYLNMSSRFGQPVQIASGRNNLSVPLVLTSEPGIETPRATLGEVHDQIEADLLAAIPNLASGTRVKASPGAARALLARLYLLQDRFAEAAVLANQVIGDSFYGLASDYTFYDNSGSTEHVFTLVNNADDGQDSFQGFTGLSNFVPNGRGDTPFTDNLIAAYEEEIGDLRFTELQQTGPDANSTIRIFTSKFPNFQNRDDDAPVIRITEMFLTRAEGNFRAGTSVGATPLADINRLRQRASLTPLLAVNLDQILNERRKELAFEGFRRMDLLRNNLSLRRVGMPDVSLSVPGADQTIFPIPQAVRDLSPFIDQNPGY